jgi:uncharacterized membrane protein YphA (DoxX/SURF4 family)
MLILFGYSHFLYTDFIMPMVPSWIGWSRVWTYVGGTALIAAGVGLNSGIFKRPVAYLLAAMLFTWFVLLHVPSAIRNPRVSNGNEIVSAFDALQFCGVALLIALSPAHRLSLRAPKMNMEQS